MNSPEPAAQAQAQQRFMVISLVRFGGVFAILGGILAANGALPFAVPEAIAYVMVVLGMGLVFVIPTLLARRWSSNRQQ